MSTSRLAGCRDLVLGLIAGGAIGLGAIHVTGLDDGLIAQGLSSVVLTTPHPGARLSGTVVLTAISGSADLEGIQFQVSGVNLGPEITAGACTAAWNTRAGSDGPYMLTVIARDAQGRRTTSPQVPVTVANSGGGGGGGSTIGNGTRRSRAPLETEKLPVTGRGGRDGGRGDGGGASAPSKTGGRATSPGACATPNPFADLPGVTGVCIDGRWIAIKKSI
jgi:hypothetical protein